jgi:hypothetical protein
MGLIERIKFLFREKLEVPQMGRNDISQDYINEAQGLLSILEAYEHGLDWFPNFKKIKKYEERFPSWKYLEVINEKNKSVVKEVNKVADEVNLMLKNKSKNISKYHQLINDMGSLIYNHDCK